MNRPATGFTLLETMIVAALVGVLAALALPSYETYIKRSRILDAVTRLADARARMDDYYLDQRTYVDDAGHCGVPAATSTTDYFIVECQATSTTFLVTASGMATKGMSAFVYTIDHAGHRATISVPGGWSRADDCWTIRKDGLCV